MKRSKNNRFVGLTDAQWSDIGAMLPKGASAGPTVRLAVTEALFRFANQSPPPRWDAASLSKAHARFAKNVRNLLASCDPLLLSEENENDANQALERLTRELMSRASYSDEQARRLQQRPKITASVEVRVPKNPLNSSGRQKATPGLPDLIAALIKVWEAEGGAIGHSVRNGKGGPLVEFLRETCATVLTEKPGADTASNWIRAWKASEEARERYYNEIKEMTSRKKAFIH